MLNILFNIFGIVVVLVITLVAYFKKVYTYWKNLGVEYLEPKIPFGNIGEHPGQKISFAEWFAAFYEKMKDKKVMHGGCYFFHVPVYVPIDLDLIKHILQVDFAHFTDHGVYVNEEDDPLSAHLFSLDGQRWRDLRVKLTPTFTSGKMKSMFPIVVKICEELAHTLDSECRNGNPVEAKDVSARLTTDIIGNCAFGIECNSLKDPKTEFRIQGKRIFDLTPKEFISNFLTFLFPSLMKKFRVRFFPKEATDFFWNVIKETTEYREKNNVRRDDALQLLIDMKNSNSETDTKLTFNELAAQAFVFFAAGFDTSSTLMCFALLELALNEDVQNKLRDEINVMLNKNNGALTYDTLAEMNYLEMIINESLRKHPPVPMLPRTCTKDYQVPNTNVLLKKGQRVFIPTRGIHYDPEYYPDPEMFDPTRFSAENKTKIHQFSFLPFGEGPRMCIGLRFAIMQVKVGLVTVIKNFKVKVNSQTKIPVKLDPNNINTSAAEDLWLDLEKI